MKPEIVVTNPLLPAVMAALAEHFTLHHLWEAPDQAAFLASIAKRARGIATFSWRVPAAVINALPHLEIIASMSVGVDAIDLAAAKSRGIPVTNAPDVLTDDVADLGIALLLAVSRRIVAADRFIRAGHWRDGDFPLSRRLGGASLGILGLGRIGRAVAQRAEAFGMQIVYGGRTPKPGISYPFHGDLVAMARQADYLLLSCTGGAETQHLVNAAVIEAVGPEGAIINIARGSVIDEAALVSALVAGRLGGAALDVFADEPNVPEALLGLDNVVLTPHVASATEATRRAMGRVMIDNLLAHFAGRNLLTRFV
jgi:lactate dehydrogenase-like 2-hydroxyacid dehydrogenase